MRTYPITAVILAKNEETIIQHAIGSVRFCSEIIVIDDESTDKTAETAKKSGAIVKKRPIEGDFASQRNFAMKQATNDWVLFIDADEEVTDMLRDEIISCDKTDVSAFYLKRRDFWWGRELMFGETKKVRNKGIIRLVKKNSGNWMGNVHEVFYTAQSTDTLRGFLDHHPHPTVKEFLHDINVYSTLRAQELYNHGTSTNIFEIIFLPLSKFILNYFIYLGFLDGPAGFAYAFFMSFHSFLVRVKLYQYHYLKRNRS